MLEKVRNFLQNPYYNTHLTLGMLLHYLGNIISQNAERSLHVKRIRQVES